MKKIARIRLTHGHKFHGKELSGVKNFFMLVIATKQYFSSQLCFKQYEKLRGIIQLALNFLADYVITITCNYYTECTLINVKKSHVRTDFENKEIFIKFRYLSTFSTINF
jgi:hypothetical protein